MDMWFNLLLIVHLVALVVGTATTIVMPVVMGRMAGASPDGRHLLAGIVNRLSLNARIAFGVLLLSGLAMVYVRYGGFEGMSPWFWVKMMLVAVVLVALILSAVARPGSINPRIMGWITRLSLLGIVVSAVFAFN